MASDEQGIYAVRVKVVESHPTCAAGHKPGEEWLWEDTTPPGLCSSIFACTFNAYLGLRFGGKEPEAEAILQSQPGQHGAEHYTNAAQTMVYRRCPDPNKRVVVSLERVLATAPAAPAATDKP